MRYCTGSKNRLSGGEAITIGICENSRETSLVVRCMQVCGETVLYIGVVAFKRLQGSSVTHSKVGLGSKRRSLEKTGKEKLIPYPSS